MYLFRFLIVNVIYLLIFEIFRSIVLNDPKLIREAFNIPALSGRPNNQVYLALGGGPYGKARVNSAYTNMF